jgi:hypothetical protein
VGISLNGIKIKLEVMHDLNSSKDARGYEIVAGGGLVDM